MPNDDDIKKEIRSLLGDRKNEFKPDPSKPNLKTDSDKKNNSVRISGDQNLVNVGGQMIIDRRRTIIINQNRRADDRITKEQQQVIREKIDNLARWDSVTVEAYDPTDTRNYSQRKKYFMRKRWAELHDRFKIRSYLQIKQKYYNKVITWLDQALQKELDKLDELDGFKKPGRKKGKSSLVCLVLAALILLFPLTVTQAPAPGAPPIAKLQPALAPPDDTPIQNAVLVDGSTPMIRAPDLPGFHFYAGCSMLRPSNAITPLSSQNI